MPFAAITGQDVAVKYLRQSLVQGRLAHALLFTGPEGVGKRAVALSLAQALNCQQAQEGEACGQCVSCRKIASGNHPDLHVLEPDGQSLKIEQIRERVQHDVFLLPVEGKSKVYILDPADTLTLAAANSLLKVLEEPPAGVTLVLITSQPFSLLDTIRSRCQEVRFRPVPAGHLAEWLGAKLACTPAQARTLAMLAGGRPAEGLRLHAEDAQVLRREVLEIAQQVSPENWAPMARRLAEYSAELPEIMGLLLTWYRDLLFLAVGSDTELIMHVDRRAELAAATVGESAESLEQKCRAILKATEQMNRNVNVQLLLEVLLMNLGRRAA